jgi:hypothetical protein
MKARPLPQAVPTLAYRRNNESSTHYNFPIIDYRHCVVFVLCREDLRADAFADADTGGGTGEPICSYTGFAFAGGDDGF